MRENLASLNNCHCLTCKCAPDKAKGWSEEEIKKILLIDYKTITKIEGGY